MGVIAQPAPTEVTGTRYQAGWFAAAALLLVWIEFISRLRFEWSFNPQYGYGWTVPFLAGFLFWRRIQAAPAPEAPRRQWPAVLAILAGLVAFLPVRLIQEANPDWRLMSWTMAFAVLAITFGGLYLAGGRPWLRHFSFPILFFLVAVPWPTQVEQFIIQGLMRADAAINVEVLNLIGIPAVQYGNVIEVGTGFVGIDEACTGVRSFQATLMLSLFFGEFYDFNATRRILLVVAGAVLAFICNLGRTFLLVWLGAERGMETIKSWHDPAGLTILTICLFGLWGLSMLMSPPLAAPNSTAKHMRGGFALPRFMPALIVILLCLAELGTQFWYRWHETAGTRLTAWDVTWPSQAPDWKTITVPEGAQELLRYSDGGGGGWTSEAGRTWNMYFFRWLPGRTAGLFIKNHRPDICLPASGMTLKRGAEHKLVTINGVPLPIRSYIFESNGTRLHVFYCYWDGTVPDPARMNEENWTAGGRLQAVRNGKRDVGTQMLELVVAGYDDYPAAERAAHEELRKIVRPG